MSEPKSCFLRLNCLSVVQKQIVQWRATHFPEDAGRPIAADNLHLTLAFLGEVSAENSGRWPPLPAACVSRALP